MPRLQPFSATRYAPSAGDPERLLAPPYDVIDPEQAAALRGLDPHNAVRLVLPEGPAPGRYELAADRLRGWLEEGVLATDPEPAVYLYEQTFAAPRVGARADAPDAPGDASEAAVDAPGDATAAESRVLTRTAIVAALEATPFAEGDVLPHEQTHRGPREDRLALMRACRAQLSPVFLVARDPEGEVQRALAEARQAGAARGPVLRARTRDGVLHVLWRLPAGSEAELLRAAGARPLLVADGHHRYETALAFAASPGAPAGAASVLVCIVGERDPGLTVLPTHRVLLRPPSGAAGWRSILESAFFLEALDEVDGRGPEEATSAARGGELVAATAGGAWLLRPRPEALARSGLGASPAVVLLDRLVLREAFGTGPDEAVGGGLLSYHRDAAEARRAAGEEGAAFLLPALEPGRVWELARAGVRLPPKSTYFWPKIPSGLLFRLLV